MLKAILFDFGGVLAEEGFREGLREIARKNSLDPGSFYAAADSLIYETGYLTGKAGESDYWDAIRKRTRVRGTDGEFREEILKRFVLRPRMIKCADLLRSKGLRAVILSDQTNWLNEINEKEKFFHHFDRVLNSSETHMSKRNASTFETICLVLGVKPEETVFVDDNKNHIKRAAEKGLNTIYFTSYNQFEKAMTAATGISCT